MPRPSGESWIDARSSVRDPEGVSQLILFLDIDGVLNRVGFRPAIAGGLATWIEPELAARLAQLIVDTSAGIVLASSWRDGRSLVQLRQEFNDANVAAPIVGTTPVLPGRPRWHEIQGWLDAQLERPRRFAILDDDWDMGPFAAQHVRVRPLSGLDDEACAAARRILNG